MKVGLRGSRGFELEIRLVDHSICPCGEGKGNSGNVSGGYREDDEGGTKSIPASMVIIRGLHEGSVHQRHRSTGRNRPKL